MLLVMKKNFQLISIIYVFLFFSSLCFSTPADVSRDLFDSFEAEGFKPQKQLLQGSLSDDFPFNIYFNFGTKNDNNSSLLLSLNQTELITIFPELCSFLRKLIDNPPRIPVTILCSTNDTSVLPSENTKMPAGLISYMENSFESEDFIAIVIDTLNFSAKETSPNIQLIAGGSGIVSPYQLINEFSDACNAVKTPYSIMIPFLTLYRLNAVHVNSRLSYFLSNRIPSFGISIKNHTQSSNTFDTVLKFISLKEKTNSTIPDEWDIHYSIFSIFNKTFVFTEKLFIWFFVIISGFALFFLCAFSFLKVSSQLQKKDLRKTWFLPFFLLLVNTLCFYTAQIICTKMIPDWSSNPLISLIFKISLSVSLFFLISYIQYFFVFPLNTYCYGFLHSLFATLNIFVFTAIDLSLLPLFAFLCVIILVTRTVKKTIPLVIVFILMLVAFIPFYTTLVLNCTPDAIARIVNTSWNNNLLFSFLIVPFQMIIMRLEVHRSFFGKTYKITKKYKMIYLSTALLCIVAVFVGMISWKNNYKFNTIETSHAKKTIESTNRTITLNTQQIKKLGFTNYSCTFTSANPVIRYDIEISSDDVLPLFEANYPVDVLSKSNTAIFNLDEYPPNPFELSWKSDNTSSPILFVTAWVQTHDRIETEHYEIDFSDGTTK